MHDISPEWLQGITETIVITKELTPDPAFPAYTDFTQGVEDLVTQQFTCEQVETFRICTRN